MLSCLNNHCLKVIFLHFKGIVTLKNTIVVNYRYSCVCCCEEYNLYLIYSLETLKMSRRLIQQMSSSLKEF